MGDTAGAEDPPGEADDKEGGGDDTGLQPEGKDAESTVDAKGKGKSGAAKEQDLGEPAGKVKAPASWKPGAREEWGNVPVAAQREIARREKHMDNMIRESADSRKFATHFNETMYPFEPLIAASNSTPMESIKQLMTTAAGLTLGTPQQKAQIVSNIMNQYGVDVVELDTLLSGQPAPAGQPGADFQATLQQELAPIRQFMGDLNSQKQGYEANQQQSMEQEITTFAQNPANEFFEDVRENMADLMEMAANRGEAMNIQTAYDKACRMDSDIYGIVNKRQLASDAATNNKNIGKKRHAASSIHGEAVGSQTGAGPSTIRGALIDAIDDAE